MTTRKRRAFEDPELARLDALVHSHEESSYRENLLEMIFIAELVQVCAMRARPMVEVARAFVDFQGYDLVATCGSITRHIQLKSSWSSASLHRALESKPSGCCIITAPYVDEDKRRIALRYRWLGGDAGSRFRFPVDATPDAKRTWSRLDDAWSRASGGTTSAFAGAASKPY